MSGSPLKCSRTYRSSTKKRKKSSPPSAAKPEKSVSKTLKTAPKRSTKLAFRSAEPKRAGHENETTIAKFFKMPAPQGGPQDSEAGEAA
jgi:hypothetical protein